MPFVMAQRTIVPVSVNACQTYTWNVNGQTYTNDTIVNYLNATGDTLFVLSLNINNPFISNETHQSATCSYEWRGTTYTSSGFYSDTIYAPANSGLCDSVYSAYITVSNTETFTSQANACGSYNWYDSTYTTSGSYSHTTFIPMAGSTTGCTHIEVLNLNITNTMYANENVAHCGNYNWYGTSYNTTGTYTHTTSDTVAGCDTIHTLNLTIVVDTANTVADSACATKTWRNHTYTTSGLYSVMDTNASNGCVTYRTLNLKIKTPRSNEFDTNLVGCNNIQFIIDLFPSSTTLKFSNNTVFDTICSDYRWNKCYDSIIHLNVVVNKSVYDTIDMNACDSFYWALNQRVYKVTPETYPIKATGKDTNGCDSMMVLNLTINSSPVISAINGEWHLNAGDTAVLYPTCTPGASYKWTYGNQTSTQDTLVINNVSGNMDVSLEATINYPANNISCHDTSWITLVTFVGINGIESTNVTLYPNPAVGQLNIESAEAVSEMTIFNTLGQQVMVQRNLGTKSLINLSNLSKGTYSMRLKLQNGETIVRKFVITK